MVGLTSQEIDSLACLWATRLDDGPLSEAAQTELDQWLAADARHLGAYARARAVAVHSRRAAALAGDNDLFPIVSSEHKPRSALLTRRNLIAASTIPVLLAGAGSWAYLRQKTLAFETRLGETRVVPLDDGSVMTLNTLSAGDVRYGESTRTVMLKAGEALFNVVADLGRPFVVRTGDMTIIANGASFLVRRLIDTPLQVVSFGGDVEIVGELGRRMKVAANTIAVLHDGVRPRSMGAVDAERELAWRHGRIQLENETLAHAVREFARYNATRITMGDDTVANMRITGLFVANDPVAFAHAVAGSLNLHVMIDADTITMSRA